MTDHDALYGALKAAREHLCRAQTMVDDPGDRDLLQGALDRIALVERDLDAGGWHRDSLRVVSRHQYQRDSRSGAGNCWCGRHEGHRIHQWSTPRDQTSEGP